MSWVELNLSEAGTPYVPRVPDVPGLREVAQATWRGRMIQEFSSGEVFDVLAQQLEASGVEARHVERCRAFAEEERLHGVLCGAVVQALGGEAMARFPSFDEVPLHEEVSPLEGAARNLLSICCLSETVAVALIGAEREDMPEGDLRDLLTRIWADECGHSNFGWRLLPQLLAADPGLAERLSTYLPVALAHLEAHELEHLGTTTFPPEGASLGLCGGPQVHALFYAAVETIIVPGLEAMGLRATEAWAQRREAGAQGVSAS